MSQSVSNLDLNALKTLLVIHQECNLQRAATRLYVTPPALTKTLNKLRAHFGDELFTKAPKGLVPTPFADQLVQIVSPNLDKLLNEIDAINDFSPANITERIVIAISPFLLHAVGSELYRRIHQQAPLAEVHLLNWSSSSLEDIEKRTVHIGVHYQLDPARKKLYSRKVGLDEFAVIARADHPHNSEYLTLKDAFSYPIATLITADWNKRESYAETLMREAHPDLQPSIVMRSELPGVIMDVVKTTDILFPLSAYFDVSEQPEFKRFKIVAEENKIRPDILVYFPVTHRQDRKTLWLISVVEDLLAEKSLLTFS